MSLTASSEPVRWSDLAWPEVGTRFEAHPTDVGLLPVGATEQHGPHLPAGTDTILATAIAEAVSGRTGATVLPAVPYGVQLRPRVRAARHHFPESRRPGVRGPPGRGGGGAVWPPPPADCERPLRKPRLVDGRDRSPPPAAPGPAHRCRQLVVGGS